MGFSESAGINNVMPVLTISGHSRKVGKTSIAEGLITALPEYVWTALKVSSHRHSGNFEGTAKDCVVIEETDREGGNDTSRFLKAGACRAFWVQAERIEAAVPAVRAILENSPYVLIEGNSVLDFIAADFSILVLNHGVDEFKKSARGILSRIDALVIIRNSTEFMPVSQNQAAGLMVHEGAPPPDGAKWENLLESVPENIPRFETGNPRDIPRALTELLRSYLS